MMAVNEHHERRLFGRRRLTIHAWVVLSRHREPCVIRNLSERGALIEFDGVPPAANNMRLLVDFEDFDVECDVRHRSGSAIGLYFRPKKIELVADTGPTGNELARQIRALWQHAEKS